MNLIPSHNLDRKTLNSLISCVNFVNSYVIFVF